MRKGHDTVKITIHACTRTAATCTKHAVLSTVQYTFICVQPRCIYINLVPLHVQYTLLL